MRQRTWRLISYLSLPLFLYSKPSLLSLESSYRQWAEFLRLPQCQPQYREWKYRVLESTSHVLYAKQSKHGYNDSRLITVQKHIEFRLKLVSNVTVPYLLSRADCSEANVDRCSTVIAVLSLTLMPDLLRDKFYSQAAVIGHWWPARSGSSNVLFPANCNGNFFSTPIGKSIKSWFARPSGDWGQPRMSLSRLPAWRDYEMN